MTIKIKNISKNWINDKETKNVLNNISFNINKNEFVCILGPSGCGKTTLLNIIAGNIEPCNGEILINNQKLNETNQPAFISQEPTLFPWKTVFENIEIGLLLKKIPLDKRKKIVNNKIELTQLKGYECYYPNQLSGGMKQKVQLARALALDNKTVLLDEPFAAMDEILKNKFDNYLLDLWKADKKTFVLVTHSIEEALFLADKIIILKPNPGEIHKEYSIDLPRPRDLFCNKIVKLRKEIRNEITKFY